MTVDCGNCIGCRIRRSRDWTIRAYGEMQTTPDKNAFLTLTYDNEHMPKDTGLHLKHLQDFIKNLRRHEQFKDQKLRYLACGEYGPVNLRPHYHLCVFGLKFEDAYPWKENNGNIWQRSETLESIWKKGFSTIGEVNLQSAGYVARYIMKKVVGDGAEHHYTRLDPETGETWQVKPDFVTVSNRPGLGFEWFEKYWRDLYPKDLIHLEGKRFAIPRYYDKLLEKKDPELLEVIKENRQKRATAIDADTHRQEQSYERLAIKEEAKILQLEQLIRNKNDEISTTIRP